MWAQGQAYLFACFSFRSFEDQRTRSKPSMALSSCSLSSLASSFSSLSFSSNVSSSHRNLSFPGIRVSRPAVSLKALRPIAAVATLPELEGMTLEKYVKTRLPGGFAAQKIIGTGRRKCAIARVVLQEGTGKFIINYRDAKV